MKTICEQEELQVLTPEQHKSRSQGLRTPALLSSGRLITLESSREACGSAADGNSLSGTVGETICFNIVRAGSKDLPGALYQQGASIFHH